MNEVNKTLYIPLYGKSKVSKQGIILNDPSAERIWEEEAFQWRDNIIEIAINLVIALFAHLDREGDTVEQPD